MTRKQSYQRGENHISTLLSNSYSAKLRDPRWQKRRLERLEMSAWSCDRCGNAEKELQVHHRWYLKGFDPWDYKMDQLETLCSKCHERATMIQDDLKSSLSTMNCDEQAELLQTRLSFTPCLFERYDTYGSDCRVANCFAEAVQHRPAILGKLVRLHDNKGSLEVYCHPHMCGHDAIAIANAWKFVGESDGRVYITDVLVFSWSDNEWTFYESHNQFGSFFPKGSKQVKETEQ